jgi:hypothetical protein
MLEVVGIAGQLPGSCSDRYRSDPEPRVDLKATTITTLGFQTPQTVCPINLTA